MSVCIRCQHLELAMSWVFVLNHLPSHFSGDTAQYPAVFGQNLHPLLKWQKYLLPCKLAHDLVLESVVNMAVMTSHDSPLYTSNLAHVSTYHHGKKYWQGSKEHF